MSRGHLLDSVLPAYVQSHPVYVLVSAFILLGLILIFVGAFMDGRDATKASDGGEC